MIRFTDVTKRYQRDHVALNDVSLFIGRGEFVFFTGASGAGKSTLLRHVYFAELPSEGEVRVGGYMSDRASRSEIAQLRRKLGVVFQDFRLLDDRTAEANVAFALEVIGTPKKQIAPRVARALAQVGLSSKGTALPTELSGGEQQRVAIARAIVNDPFVLVADEPTGNLDERATNAIFQLLRDINAAGTAVLMATHDMDLVRSVEYRTVELEHGNIIGDSKPSVASSRSEAF